jgi:hypothetical protein
MITRQFAVCLCGVPFPPPSRIVRILTLGFCIGDAKPALTVSAHAANFFGADAVQCNRKIRAVLWRHRQDFSWTDRPAAGARCCELHHAAYRTKTRNEAYAAWHLSIGAAAIPVIMLWLAW